VASEGNDALVELDALAVDPTTAVLRSIPLGRNYGINPQVAESGGAPQGIALSDDEQTAYVLCRSTYDVVTVPLGASTLSTTSLARPQTLHLAGDPLGESGATGRKLFYNATDDLTSGGLACAGCHPEGRDDGFTWTEVTGPDIGTPIFVGGSHVAGRGVPRQTPMLAGRVAAKGPYGWKAQSETLAARAVEGFHLHRWAEPASARGGDWDGPVDAPETRARREKIRANALAAFLREGLVPPPSDDDGSLAVRRGKELFFSDDVGCSNCHLAGDYTDRLAHRLAPLPPLMGFEADDDPGFKTPSLIRVGGTPPYFHDGREASLDDLIEHNNNRMGRTNQLSAEDKAALVAFLKTL
jgi:cytochrome c peroxidase